MNNGEISFSRDAVGKYRKERVEDLTVLFGEGEKRPEISQTKIPTRTLMKTPPSSAVVFQLFRYLKPEFVSRLSHSYGEILHSIKDRCCVQGILEYIERERKHIETILRTMSTRLALEILTLDTRGSKLEDIQSRLEELYFLRENDRPIRGCKANFENTDQIERLLLSVGTTSLNQATDTFYMERAGTRRRGRTPHSAIDKKPNRVNAIKSDFILSCKSLPPVSYDENENLFYIDYLRSSAPEIASAKENNSNLQYQVDFYPVFVKVLNIRNDCLPTPNNHGFYQNRVLRGLRKLTSGEWPMKGLMRSLINAEAVLGRSELVLPKTENTYYCAYTGERLVEGEKVWHIRILVNDARRYKKWVKDKIIPASPNTSSEFTHSVKAYFIKSSVTAQCSIFYQPMDPEYKKLCLSSSSTSTSTTHGISTEGGRLTREHQLSLKQYHLPYNRQISVNTLWYTLSQLRVTLSKQGLEEFIHFPFRPSMKKLPFKMLLTQYTTQIRALSDRHEPRQNLRTLLFIATIPWFDDTSMDDPEVSLYLDMVYDTVLDFIELMFPFTELSRSEPFPVPHQRRVLVFPRLELPLPGQKDSLIQIKPRLGNTMVLGTMLELCDKRPRNREVNQERLEKLIIRHPCLFLSFFYTLYQVQYDATQQQQTPLSTYFKLLSRMNLFVESSSSSSSY